MTIDPFDFDELPGTRERAFIATVPRGITQKAELLAALSERLELPEYFGFNWDALSDCLRDLHWIPQRHVFLLHGDVPALPASDLRCYLDVLADAVGSWRNASEHDLRVVFPREAAQRLEALMTAPA